MISEKDIENEEAVGVFPQTRLDQMAADAQKFVAAAWQSKNGDRGALQRYRADAQFDFAARQDSGAESIFIARQLEFIRKGLYEIKYAALKSPQLVSYVTSTPRGVQQLTVKAIDVAGEPMIERDDSSHFPTVEMKVSSVGMGFFNMNLAYSFTDQDAAEAMYAGMPLQTAKAAAVRTAMARKADQIAFYGETTTGVKGLLNQTGTTTYATPATGAGGSKKFADKDPDTVLADLNAAGDAIINATGEIEVPDTWLLPLDAYRNIANRRVGDGTNATILQYFKDTRGKESPLEIVATTKSQGANNAQWAGSGSESRMLVYKNDQEHLEFQLPVPFYQGAPQYSGFRTTVHCMMRCGGVALWLPASACYADGVS
jgi:hypothetical protein